MSQPLSPQLPPFEDIDEASWRHVYAEAALALTARSKTYWPEWRELSPERREGFKRSMYARWTRSLFDRDDR